MADTSMKERLLDAAEKRARAGGYNGFSFRDVAADVGVKSASVHYHFPTKADLGEAIARRYTERTRVYLEERSAASPKEAQEAMMGLFRQALTRDNLMCLCGLFGAETDALPDPVRAATAAYFRLLMDYLAEAFGANWQGEPPAALLAKLEGALLLARTLKDPTLFDTALEGCGDGRGAAA